MNENKTVLNVVDMLNYSASLVEQFGKSRLANGKTLEAALTIDGIPFWDLFSVEFAHSHISGVLRSDILSKNIIHQLRPYLSRLKHSVSDFIRHRHNTEGCATWPPKKTVLCLGFTPQMYRDLLQPVIARLAMRNDCYVVVLSDQSWPGLKSISSDRCKYQAVWQHWTKEVGKEVRDLQKSIRQTDVKLQLLNALSGIIPDMYRHLFPNFKNLFNWFFKVSLPHIVPQVVLARHILKKHRPALVISPDTADSRTRAYTVLCQLMGIPCMDIQFGLAGDEAIEWRFLAADRVAIWGETSKEAILKQKVPIERIAITGSPRHDCLVNLSLSEVQKKRAMLGVPEKSALIVLASTYCFKTRDNYADPKILRAMQHAIFEAADRTSNIFLIIKPHPVEDGRETQVLLGKSPNVLFVDGSSDIRELITVCDAFISFGSTTTIDALIAHKLTICPIFPGWTFSDIFKHSGATLVPESAEELANIFKMVADGSHSTAKARLEPARQAFLQRYMYRIDGLAAARVEALAVKMAGIEQ